MLYLIVILLSTVQLGYSAVVLGYSIPCIDMELAELCKQAAVCRHEIQDLAVLCATSVRRSQAQTEITVLQSTLLPYHDASVPVILDLTGNLTVAPGGIFKIECLAEGGPTPYVEITPREYADMSPLEDDNTLEVEHGVIKVVYSQPYVEYFDEGWYRCVSRNSQGVVSQDTFVTVVDLCDGSGCEEDGLVCEPNYDLGIAECTCPYCTDEDYDSGQIYYCGSNCATYEALCSLHAENCNYGTDVTLFKEDFCDIFSLPEFVLLPNELEMTVEEGTIIQLTCSASPSGDSPGPPPTISWYDDWGLWLDDGDVLSYLVEYDVVVSCIARHCSGSLLQNTTLHGADVAIFLQEERDYHTYPVSTPTISTMPVTYIVVMPVKEHTGRSCQILGDAYISTYDDLWYKQDGVCTYVVSMDCELAQWFIYGRFSECGTATCLESVTLYYGRSMLEIQRGWLLNRHGEKISVIVNEVIEVDGILVEFDGEFVTAKFGENNEVRWNGFNGVQIVTEAGKTTCGLCGNNNGISSDDYYSRWLGDVEGKYSFISSWALPMSNYICYYNEHETTGNDEGTAACSDAFDNQYISPCHDTVDVAPYITTCIASYTTNSYPDLRAECNVLQSYVLMCQTAGLAMLGWRQDTMCTELEDLQQFTINQGCPQDNPPV